MSSPDTSTEHETIPSESGPLPTISVIMATYNCITTVEKSIESIVAQTYSDWELVVCDDGSTDGTFELLQVIAARLTPRMTLLRNRSNRRLPYSLNQTILASSGRFIARMDADDLSEPTRLARQAEFLESHPEYAVVGTGMRRFNESGLGEVLHPVAEPNRETLGRGGTLPFFHATILARRSMFDLIGNYTVSWHTERGQDVDLWFKFFHAGFSGANLVEPLYLVREDAAAIRRRTPRVRIGAYVTRIKGNRMLGYPLRWYIRPTVDLLKVLVPYRVFDWQREMRRRRFNRSSAGELGTADTQSKGTKSVPGAADV